MKLSTIESRNDAEAAVGSFLSVTRAELVALPDGTLFQFEIVGMRVVTETGEELGRIVRVLEMPANDVWRVEGAYSFDLPATGNIVVAVDKEARTVTVKLIEGLLDLNK
jgi:16S rRNA processing protein RimM